MKTLTTLSIALVMAFAFSGPVMFTSTPAHAFLNWCFIGNCMDDDVIDIGDFSDDILTGGSSGE